MDLRKQKPLRANIRPDSKSTSPYQKQPMRQTMPPSGQSSNAQIGHGMYGKHMVSPSQEEALLIEQRHEELKKQIALKERQLADMTGERDTVNILRQRLGMDKSFTPGSAFANLMQKDEQKVESARRGMYSSSSPQHQNNYQVKQGMVGMQSSHFRGTSQEDQQYQQREIERQEPQPRQYDQQLQFHPTRLPRISSRRGSVERTSALRHSQSRSKSKGHSRGHVDESVNLNERHISPYDIRDRDSGSPQNRMIYQPADQTHESSQILMRPQPILQNPFTEQRYHQSNVSFSPIEDSQQQMQINMSYINNTTVGEGPEARDKLYRDRIEAMTLDNQSLQRRLNQVSSEMERIMRENEDIQRQISMTEGDVNRMSQLVNNKDDIDAQNSIMQNDLERIKMVNIDMNNKLNDEEGETQTVGNQLHCSVTGVQSSAIENDNMNNDFNYKLRQMDDISREKVMNQQKLNNVNVELERLNRQELQLGHDNIDLETHIARLQAERRDLLASIERITINYDQVGRELGNERRGMDNNNDWHTKLIVTKNLFENLTKITKVRKQRVFTEVAQYCEFDRDCHLKLRCFAKTLQKLGEYKLKVGLNKWYDRTLKPLGTRIQNDDISIQIDCNRLQAKVFYAWRQYNQDKIDCYTYKTNAIQRMWHRMQMDANREMKRAMDIWKAKQIYQKLSTQKFRALMKKRENKYCEQALYTWKAYSCLLEHSCRMRVLQIDTTTKVYMSQLFSQMRLTLRNEKRKRQRTLNAFLKAWQDQVIYNRHLMQTNMAAIQFGNCNRTYTMQAVFNALKQHTESKKFGMMHQAVHEDMNVAIAQTQSFNNTKSNSFATADKQRATNIVRDMMGKRLFAYFMHWNNVSVNYKQTMNTKVKDLVLRGYIDMMRSFFNGWKKNGTVKVTKKKMKIVQQSEQGGQEAANIALEEQKNLRKNAEAVNTSTRKMIDKTFRKLFLRRLDVAVGRWKDICVDKSNKEDTIELMKKRMRNRFLRQAFDRYLHFLRKSQQHTRNVGGSDYMRDVLRIRQLRKVYFAMCYHTQWKLRVKRIWNKVLYRLDAYEKKRVMQQWNDNAHQKYEQILNQKQGNVCNQIENYNEQLGSFQMDTNVQDQEIDNSNKFLNKAAYRQIANFFQRCYTDKTNEKFKIWKHWHLKQLHKEKIMRFSIQHYERRYTEACSRNLLKFLSDKRRVQKIEEIKESKKIQKTQQIQINFNDGQQTAKRDKDNEFLQNRETQSNEVERKIMHIMEVQERRARDLVCRSKKRMIFDMWNHTKNMEKAFCYAVKNVLEKSLFKQGFEQINWYARDEEYTRKVHRSLRKFALNRERIFNLDGFNKWKLYSISKVDNKTKEVNDQLDQENAKFNDFRDKAKNANVERVFRYFVKNNRQNIFRGWRNVTNHFILVKQKEKEFKQRQLDIQRATALIHWKKRAYKTRQCHTRNDQLIQQFQWKYVKATFYGWQKQWKQDKKFIVNLSNFEKMMRTKMFMDSFNTIKGFTISKKIVLNKKKNKGTEDLVNLVKASYLKQLGIEFQKYKEKCQYTDGHAQVLTTCYTNFCNSRIRDAFNWWKRKHELKELAKDLHETGPVRAEHWRAEKEIDNLKDFMKSEHYTEDEIDKIYDDVCDKNEFLMKKYMIRMQIRQDGKRKILPQIINRWKEYTSMRKLIKYQFRQCHNALDAQKTDMQRAFKKWRSGPEILGRELWRLPLETITNLAMKTTTELDDCQEQISENQSINNHLVLQRDEFLNYYIKGQILAMALLKDRKQFTEMQGLSRWLLAKYRMFREENKRDFEAAYYLEANLKKDEERLNSENDTLEKENTDLAQFTKDGEIVKSNMNRIQGERDKVAADIAETDDDLRELQKRNEDLQKLVDEMEKEALDVRESGGNPKFAPKKADGAPEEEAKPKESSAEKAKRVRFENLQKRSAAMR